MKNSVTRDAFLAIAAVIAALVPFLNKAFHIDDPLFLWMAQQVSQHPADPYGFSVNWYVSAKPMFSIMQNPPLNAYYMALAAKFLGWTELAMHGAFLVPAVAAVLGTFFLAQRLSGSPLLGALLMLFTPVFLISATTVMCDVWLLALWVWSVDCWLRGLERHSYWLLLLASLLTAAATLTKYFGVSLVPLLAVYTVVRERRLTSRLLFLLIPIAIIGIYEAITKAKYGQGLFTNAMIYPWQAPVKAGKQLSGQFLTGLSFTGGCLFPALFYVPFLKSRNVLISGIAIFLALLPLFYLWVARGLTSRTDVIAVTVEGALFATIGVGILALAVCGSRPPKNGGFASAQPLGVRHILFCYDDELVHHLANDSADGAGGGNSLDQTIQKLRSCSCRRHRGQRFANSAAEDSGSYMVAASTGCTCFPAGYSGRLQTGRHRALRLQVLSKSIPERAGYGMVRRTLGLPILYGTLEGEAIGPH